MAVRQRWRDVGGGGGQKGRGEGERERRDRMRVITIQTKKYMLRSSQRQCLKVKTLHHKSYIQNLIAVEAQTH